MHPLSRALLDFHAGHRDVAFTIRRDDGFQQRVPAALFFDSEFYPALEKRAMDECRGRILDMGCAVGRHSLALLRCGFAVTSLDILPEMESILNDRGQGDVVNADVMEFSGRRFDTLLMLMNGIGMVGSMEGLVRFLRHAHELVLPGGQIVCDSIDVNVTTDPQHIAYRKLNLAAGRPAGQQVFTIEYDGEDADRFDWLHIDFPSLAYAAQASGWEAEILDKEDSGHYLCKLIQSKNHEQERERKS